MIIWFKYFLFLLITKEWKGWRLVRSSFSPPLNWFSELREAKRNLPFSSSHVSVSRLQVLLRRTSSIVGANLVQIKVQVQSEQTWFRNRFQNSRSKPGSDKGSRIVGANLVQIQVQVQSEQTWFRYRFKNSRSKPGSDTGSRIVGANLVQIQVQVQSVQSWFKFKYCRSNPGSETCSSIVGTNLVQKHVVILFFHFFQQNLMLKYKLLILKTVYTSL